MGMVCEVFLQNTLSMGESVFSESLQKKEGSVYPVIKMWNRATRVDACAIREDKWMVHHGFLHYPLIK